MYENLKEANLTSNEILVINTIIMLSCGKNGTLIEWLDKIYDRARTVGMVPECQKLMMASAELLDSGRLKEATQSIGPERITEIFAAGIVDRAMNHVNTESAGEN